jgi:hypothetical protein
VRSFAPRRAGVDLGIEVWVDVEESDTQRLALFVLPVPAVEPAGREDTI